VTAVVRVAVRVLPHGIGGLAQDVSTIDLSEEEWRRHWLDRVEQALGETMIERHLRSTVVPAHVIISDAVAREAVEHNERVASCAGFARVDTEATSQLFCPCGASLTWEGVDDRLQPWLAEHRPHLAQDTGAGTAT
jgi:hypothetical protein